MRRSANTREPGASETAGPSSIIDNEVVHAFLDEVTVASSRGVHGFVGGLHHTAGSGRYQIRHRSSALFFEAEPHLSIAPFNADKVGIGAGFAGTFNVANEGFIKRLNDSVGVGFGVDWTGNKNWNLSGAMQWNFWLSDKWSVFGAPGVAVHLHDSNVNIRPAFGAGGRYHFTPNFALTMRVGYPVSAVGLSFFF